MSKREELRRRRQSKVRRTQLTGVGMVTLAALAVSSFLIYQNTRPIGEIVPIERQAWPLADGKALGPAEARVVIQEFSDFQ
jgi:hypothetical protein